MSRFYTIDYIDLLINMIIFVLHYEINENYFPNIYIIEFVVLNILYLCNYILKDNEMLYDKRSMFLNLNNSLVA